MSLGTYPVAKTVRPLLVETMFWLVETRSRITCDAVELQADIIGVTGDHAIREDENMMNPVIGMDISKGQSEGQAFLNKGQPYGKSFCFLHTQEGLEELFNIVKTVQNKTGVSPLSF